MAAARFYSSTAGLIDLTASINSSVTSITVSTTTGLPGTTPFTLVLDPGTSTEEIVNVTNVAGLTLTVSRGVDGSSAQSHSAGVGNVRHMATARDFREPQEHIGASAAVHGLTGTVVGTTDTQSLTNKTALAASAATKALVVKGAASQSAALLDVQDSAGTSYASVNPAEGSFQVGSGQAKVNATAAANLFKYIARWTATAADVVVGVFRAAGSQTADIVQIQNSAGTVLAKFDSVGALTAPGATIAGAPAATTTGVQTLTNKTIDGGSNTLANIPESAVTNLSADLNYLGGRCTTLEAAATYGRTTVTTDASGNAIIAHGLGAVPAVVIGTGEITASPGMIVNVFRAGTTSTNLNFVCFKDDGTRYASTSVVINWIARR